MSAPDQQEDHYMHGADAAEQDRLEQLAVLLGGAEFLPPLNEGMNIIEFGCGTGAIARDVATRIAPGEVVGLDRQEAQLETARRIASDKGLKNVRFKQANAENAGEPDSVFDAAYCRFVLEHVADPVRVAQEMARVVKPGGWVCAYEWDNSCGTLFPESPAVKLVWEAIYRLQDMRGGDSRITGKLYGIFKRAGLANVRAEGFAWTITADERNKLEGYVGGAREIMSQTRDDLLAEKLVQPADLSAAEAQYQLLLESPDAYVFEGFCRATGEPANDSDSRRTD